MCASFRAMHTKVELLAVGVDDEKGRDLMQRAEAEVRRLERLLSCHDDASPLSALNSLAWEQSVEAEDELYMVLELCETFRRATYGYFDVTAMCSETDGVMSLAGGYSLDAKHHSVRFCRKGVKIDLGGFAKGYALDCIKRMSQQEGITQGVINFGNSSIAALGHHPYGEWWPIGIEHRMVKSALAQEVRLADSAMSISGRSEAGEYHIIDPHTGSRVAGEELILIEGRSALVCEVLSTALYAAPRAKRADIMSQYDGYRASEIVCRRDGTTECRVVGATVVEK
ncbi:MAG: FAD:protein FMN transferase [Alistipes sp.]|nr:FAD:protein FMN transferase [Alistipes sp.]